MPPTIVKPVTKALVVTGSGSVALDVPRDLVASGFELPSEDINYRMLISSQGLEKSGKTEFALSAPGPIAIINMDDGLEGVVEKWVKKKRLWIAHFPIPPMGDKNTYLAIWRRTEDAFMKALANKDVRTIMIDTGSDWWELCRLAEFGALSPAVDIKRAYGPLNQKFRSFIKAAYQTDKNLIMTHKMKELYTVKQVVVNGQMKNQDSWDGESYKRTGFGENNFLIQVNLEHRYRGGKFETEIINCRQDMSIAGYVMDQKESNFQTLGTMVFEGTSKEDWQ